MQKDKEEEEEDKSTGVKKISYFTYVIQSNFISYWIVINNGLY